MGRVARNPFPPALREMMPWQYVPLVTSQENPLTSTEGWYEAKNAPFDVSMRDFLRKQGATDPMIDIAYDTIPTYGLNAKDISALMMAYVSAFTAAQKSAKPVMLQARGGNQNIPLAMAAQLQQPVRLKQTVKAIESTAAGSLSAPPTALDTRRVPSCAPCRSRRCGASTCGRTSQGMQERAVNSLPYQPIHQVALQVSRPFWEDDDLEPSMWTDSPIGRVSAVYHEEKDDQVSSLLVSAFGPGARHLDRLGKEGAARYVVSQIEQMRPAAKGALQVIGQHSWEQDPFAGGAWADFNPGTVTKFLPAMFQPRGRVHFCGEHTSVTARGMEGAIQLGERAAGAVAQQLAQHGTRKASDREVTRLSLPELAARLLLRGLRGFDGLAHLHHRVFGRFADAAIDGPALDGHVDLDFLARRSGGVLDALFERRNAGGRGQVEVRVADARTNGRVLDRGADRRLADDDLADGFDRHDFHGLGIHALAGQGATGSDRQQGELVELHVCVSVRNSGGPQSRPANSRRAKLRT